MTPRTEAGKRLLNYMGRFGLGNLDLWASEIVKTEAESEAVAVAFDRAELAAKVRGLRDHESTNVSRYAASTRRAAQVRAWNRALDAVLTLIEPSLFDAAIADPATKAALDAGLADLAAGRVKPWEPER